jgi:hypothetical protein
VLGRHSGQHLEQHWRKLLQGDSTRSDTRSQRWAELGPIGGTPSSGTDGGNSVGVQWWDRTDWKSVPTTGEGRHLLSTGAWLNAELGEKLVHWVSTFGAADSMRD